MTKALRLLPFVAALAAPALAADAYVLRFAAVGRGAACDRAVWRDELLFYNQTDAPAAVRFLGVSNGTSNPSALPQLVLPSRRVIAVSASATGWEPSAPGAPPQLWVVHLDIPVGVVVESRDEVRDEQFCIPGHVLPEPISKVSMPIFRDFVAADQPQVILGTDLGTAAARQNVAIYNAGAAPANATITLYRTCDDTIVEQRASVIPPNAIVQIGGISTGQNTCTSPDTFGRYTKVVVDQPSVSWVTTLTEGQTSSTTPRVIPAVELAVAVNSRF